MLLRYWLCCKLFRKLVLESDPRFPVRGPILQFSVLSRYSSQGPLPLPSCMFVHRSSL